LNCEAKPSGTVGSVASYRIIDTNAEEIVWRISSRRIRKGTDQMATSCEHTVPWVPYLGNWEVKRVCWGVCGRMVRGKKVWSCQTLVAAKECISPRGVRGMLESWLVRRVAMLQRTETAEIETVLHI